MIFTYSTCHRRFNSGLLLTQSDHVALEDIECSIVLCEKTTTKKNLLLFERLYFTKTNKPKKGLE